MKATFKYGIFLLVILALVGNAKADSFSSGGVVYTITSRGSDGSGGFLVDLAIDFSGVTFGVTLQHIEIDGIALQFIGATNVRNVRNNAGWEGPDLKGGLLPFGDNFWNFIFGPQSSPINVPGGFCAVCTFEFDVTGLSSPPTKTQLLVDGSIAVGEPPSLEPLSLLFSDVAITAPVSTPEPSSLTMLGIALVAVAGLFLKGLLKT